jgi:hypothetical protein
VGDPRFAVFRWNDEALLVSGLGRHIMIYPGQQLVDRVGRGGNRLGPFLWWERGWDYADPNADPYKGDTGDT